MSADTGASNKARATIPHLRTQGTTKQLIVDDKPYLILGGELHNSSGSSLAYMEPVWQRMQALHINTVLVAVSWELVEPEEGQFDFTLLDGLIHGARRHDLRLVILWFGSWKNGQSSYIPAWVKRDYKRFPRVRTRTGEPLEILSTFAEANWQADAKAFAAMMEHLRKVDERQNTVIMVQVENEVGILSMPRDYSPEAEEAFNSPIPQRLASYLESNREQLIPSFKQLWETHGAKTNGSWPELFGDGTGAEEAFMAWHYSRYVDQVAAAGRAVYELPLFVNAWLNFTSNTPGDYPSGGPLPHVFDLWLAGTESIDLLTPDIYAVDFDRWCRDFTQQGNPLFIPEMMPNDVGARAVFYAIGEHSAIGTSPFAVDIYLLEPENTSLAKSYALLESVSPQILANQGLGKMVGFNLDLEHPSTTRYLNGYRLEISLDEVFHMHSEIGYGLIIANGPDSFLGVGNGFRVHFYPQELSNSVKVGLASVDEGRFENGRWIAGRRLNGDENDQGRAWRFSPHYLSTQICEVYSYE